MYGQKVATTEEISAIAFGEKIHLTRFYGLDATIPVGDPANYIRASIPYALSVLTSLFQRRNAKTRRFLRFWRKGVHGC